MSAVYVRFRDIDHIWDVVRQALFYTIPIIYPLNRITSIPLQKVIILNPLSQIIQDARVIVTYPGTTTINDLFGSRLYELLPVGATIFIFIFGYKYFSKRADSFAEDV